MTSVWTIYALLDPDTKEVRYVGYTRRSIEDRIKYHDWDSRRPGPHGKTRKAVWMRSLKRRKRAPGVAILQAGTGNWEAAEKFWIAAFGNAGMRLLNMTVGGKGVKR
jgi:hypothetical protein